MKTSTARGEGDAFFGVHTLSVRQSSDWPAAYGSISGYGCPCGQLRPSRSALSTPLQGAAGCGGFQRSAPTGGAAYGTPVKSSTPAVSTPSSAPVSIVTRGGAVAGRAATSIAPASSESSDAAGEIERIREASGRIQ